MVRLFIFNSGKYMKKYFCLFLCTTAILIAELGAEAVPAEIRERYPDAKEIELAGRAGYMQLFVVTYERMWSSCAVLFDASTGMAGELSCGAPAVYSAKIIHTGKGSIAELVDITHQGNGYIYLYSLNGSLLFSYYFLDSHCDYISSDDLQGKEAFKDILAAGGACNRLIKGDTLAIDYSAFEDGLIRIYGIVLYTREESDGTQTTVHEVPVERLFKYNASNKRYELIEKTGEVDSVFGMKF